MMSNLLTAQGSIEFVTPCVIRLPENTNEVKEFLTFKDKTVQYQISRLQKNFYYQEEWKASAIENLKSQLFKGAYWESDGVLYTYGGLANKLSEKFGWNIFYPNIQDPIRQSMPWKVAPEFAPWPHQDSALSAMLSARHAAVSIPTGGGKSRVIIDIIKELGQNTVVITPSKSISYQIYNEMVQRFGANKVGFFGDGKKDIKKMITVAISASLARVKEGSKEWDFFKTKNLLIADESHTVPRDTLEPVCMNLLGHCSRRYFVSATQMRNDGKDLLLEGIIGPIVYEKAFSELVDEKILAEPIWRFFTVPADPVHGYASDAMKETRNQLFKNDSVARIATDIANMAVSEAKRPTVILIEEFSQFLSLMDRIKVPFVFAHGGSSSSDEDSSFNQLPDKYKKMESADAIADFNSGRVSLLIGTSAVSVGVDLKPTQCLIYLQGGTSEIKVKQAIGRGTRMGVPGKKDCWVVDFVVKGSKTLERHAMARKEIYESMYGSAVVLE